MYMYTSLSTWHVIAQHEQYGSRGGIIPIAVGFYSYSKRMLRGQYWVVALLVGTGEPLIINNTGNNSNKRHSPGSSHLDMKLAGGLPVEIWP